MLKIVNKNNKNSYRVVQEIHLDEDCVINSQTGETLESIDVVKDLSVRLDKTSHDDLTNLANGFRLCKAEMKQQLTSLQEHFLESQKDTLLPKSSLPNLYASLLSHGSEHTIQNEMVKKSYGINTNSEFIINLLKDRIFLLEQQLIEKASTIDFLVKHQTWSNINCDNKILNHESTEAIKNKIYQTTILTKVIGRK